MRGRTLLVAILIAAALLVGMGMGVGATENTSENETAPEQPAEIQMNNDTTITDYELEDGWLEVTFDSDVRTRVVIVDSMHGIGQEGAVEVPQEDFVIDPGESTIGMEVTEFMGGASVSVNIDGQAVRLSSELEDEGENPLQYFGGESGLFTGIFGSMIFALGAAGFVVWREDSGVIEA